MVPPHVWTPQQKAIFQWFETGTGNLVVQARAGSAKTSTLIQGVTHHLKPNVQVLFTAFNKHSATDLETKLGKGNPNRVVKTLHALGYQILREKMGSVRVDGRHTKTVIETIAGRGKYLWKLAKLADAIKDAAPWAKTVDEVIACGLELDVLLDPEKDMAYAAQAQIVLSAMNAALRLDNTISFSDMVFIPYRMNWATLDKFDTVCVDECLVGDTPILLADGTTKPIQQLVEDRQPLKVLSYDPISKRQVVKHIVDFKKVLLQKKTFRIKIQPIAVGQAGQPLSLRVCQNRLGNRSLVCTQDHRIFTARGWVEAQHLREGDIVQVESGAPRDLAYTHKYKHGRAGKQKLARGLRKRHMPRGVHKGHAIPNRGGNGHGLTVPQQVLLAALGPPWTAEYVLPTGGRIKGKRPTHYKIDIANPTCKIAIECDGMSHDNPTRQAADRRKDAFLATLGWRVHRFKNLDIVRRSAEIAAQFATPACPIDGVVTAVEEHTVKDYFVYDLTIEDTHCYYAHGILVHNCQDVNPGQLELALRCVAPAGRTIVVGDEKQALYFFRGATKDVFTLAKNRLNAVELPLTVSFRCSKAVVAEARKIVPDIQVLKTAPDGAVDKIYQQEMLDEIAGILSDSKNKLTLYVLSRFNAPLFPLALKLLERRVPCTIQGRDFADKLVETVESLKPTSRSDLDLKLDLWGRKRLKGVDKEDPDGVRLIADVEDTIQAIRIVADHCGKAVHEIGGLIRQLFEGVGSSPNRVTLSTVHRIKGFEADIVFVLTDTLITKNRLLQKKFKCDATEYNIEYVAITRAKSELWWVLPDVDDETAMFAPDDGFVVDGRP